MDIAVAVRLGLHLEGVSRQQRQMGVVVCRQQGEGGEQQVQAQGLCWVRAPSAQLKCS